MTKKSVFFLFMSLVFLTAPFWLPPIQLFFQQTFFLTARSVSLLGFILLAGQGSVYVLPDSTVKSVHDFSTHLKIHFRLVSFCFFALLFTALLVTNQYILSSFFSSGDEHSCYFLAECIRQGKLWVPTHPLREFFEVVHVGSVDGKWFSVYPPGWPLIFALGLQFHIANLINPMLTLISVFFLFKIGSKIFGFWSSVLGISLMAITPFFLLNSASYFSHATCLLTIVIFVYAYLKWVEKRTLFWAVLCAFAIGFGLNTRYLTMAAMAAPFLTYELFLLIKKEVRWTKSHLVFGIILAIGVLFTFYYNYLVTGSPLEAPNHYYHHWERLGFHDDYTPVHATLFVIYRLFFLMDWIPPIFLFCYLMALTQKNKFDVRAQLVRFSFLYLVVAYFFYYSWGGNQYGPRYYFGGIPFLFLTASGMIHKRWSNGDKQVKKFIVGVILASMIANVYLLIHHGWFNRLVSRERKSLYDLAEKTVRKPAIVFIGGFLGDTLIMAGEDAIRNHPNLKGEILYAHDLKGKNEKLMEYYPERNFYLGSYDRKLKQPKLELVKGLK